MDLEFGEVFFFFENFTSLSLKFIYIFIRMSYHICGVFRNICNFYYITLIKVFPGILIYLCIDLNSFF